MAVMFAGEILQQEPQALTAGHDLTVTVSDERHLTLFNLHAMSTLSPAISGR